MPTFYNYAKRGADSYVNWAKIGMDMSKMVADENKAREDKKEELNQATRKTLDELANAPMGENQDINGVVADAANNATEYVKMQEKLFKSGQLKYSDYIHNRQNITDGYKNLFGASKTMQADWTATQERVRKGEASKTDIDVKATLEGLGNIANTKIYINPTNGMVSVAKTKKEIINGKEVITMDSDPNKMFTISELLNYSKQKFDKFKTDEVDAQVKVIGKKTDSIIHQGTLDKIGDITSITDPNIMSRLNTDAEKQQVTNFKKYVTDTANIFVEGDASKAQSILRDYVDVNPKTGKPYEIRFTNKYDSEEAKKNPDVIYLQKESSGRLVPVLSDEQKKVARDFVEARIYAGIDQERKIQATQYRPDLTAEWKYRVGKEEEKKDSFAQNWFGLYTAKTPEEKSNFKQGVIGIMKSMGQDVRDIKFDKDGKTATIVYEDPSKNRPITLKDQNGKPVSSEKWMRAGSEFTGPLSDKIMKKYIGGQFQDITDWTGVTGGMGYGYTPPVTQDNDIVSRIVEDDGAKSADNLNKLYKDRGYQFKTSGGIIDQGIYISADNGETWSAQEFLINDKDEIASAEKSILTWMKDNPSLKQQEEAKKQQEPPAPTSVPMPKTK